MVLSATCVAGDPLDAKDADPVVMAGGGARALTLFAHAEFYTRLSSPAQNVSLSPLYLLADS